MPAISRLPPSTVSLRNVLGLTLLSLLTTFALISAVTLSASLVADHFPAMAVSLTMRPLRIASIILAQFAYFGFCVYLARREAPWLASLRFGFLLQMQAMVELLCLIGYGLIVSGGIYLLAGVVDDTGTQESMLGSLASGNLFLCVFLVATATPAAAILVASLRLHVLSRRPGALPGMIDGTLPVRKVVVRGDILDSQSELVRHLERLTSPATPGLGRIMYGSHPKLTTHKEGELSVHELTWWTCPMKLRISLHAADDRLLELHVRCRLRGGSYRASLVPTPADVVAQMQYIDSHLVRPFVGQLEQLSTQRQHDALRDQAVEAQLRILQAQIEPHFLFNTLANLRQLYRSSHADGESMLDHLITYLRCAMDDLRAEQSSIVKEMDLAMHYLAIMQIRLGERLAYRFSVPDALMGHPMPPAMLISLVENAIKHGIADMSRGEITLSAASDGALLRVSVADNGMGFSSVGGTGVGLSNIRQRLEAIYGSRAWLEVGAPAQGGFTATIVIPLEAP